MSVLLMGISITHINVVFDTAYGCADPVKNVVKLLGDKASTAIKYCTNGISAVVHWIITV